MPDRQVTLEDWIRWKHRFTVLVMTLLTIVVVAMIAGFIGVQIIVNARTDAHDAKTKVDTLARTLSAKNAQDIYEGDLREREACLEFVQTSNNNRAQHEANITAWATFGEKLKKAFPNSDSVAFIDESIAEVQNDLKTAPLLSAEPRKVEECPPPPTPPVEVSVGSFLPQEGD